MELPRHTAMHMLSPSIVVIRNKKHKYNSLKSCRRGDGAFKCTKNNHDFVYKNHGYKLVSNFDSGMHFYMHSKLKLENLFELTSCIFGFIFDLSSFTLGFLFGPLRSLFGSIFCLLRSLFGSIFSLLCS